MHSKLCCSLGGDWTFGLRREYKPHFTTPYKICQWADCATQSSKRLTATSQQLQTKEKLRGGIQVQKVTRLHIDLGKYLWHKGSSNWSTHQDWQEIAQSLPICAYPVIIDDTSNFARGLRKASIVTWNWSEGMRPRIPVMVLFMASMLSAEASWLMWLTSSGSISCIRLKRIDVSCMQENKSAVKRWCSKAGHICEGLGHQQEEKSSWEEEEEEEEEEV